MLTQGQTRFLVTVCLILIVAILLINLRYNTMSSLLTAQFLSSKKENSPVLSMVQESDYEEAYNKELSIIRQKGLSANLKNSDLTNFTVDELRLTIHTYPDNTDVTCRRKLRMGNIGDGGWEICDDPDVRPRQPCIIYSFGINYDFTFDDDAANVYGCDVYSFDPSMAKYEDKVERSKLVHFYKVGLSGTAGETNGWKLYTLEGIRAMLGHQYKSIDVLKMDIESAEWSSIPEMCKSGQLNGVKQLMVEYHVTDNSLGYLLPRLQAMQCIEQAGFKRYYVHKNEGCGIRIQDFPIIRSSCYEVHYILR